MNETIERLTDELHGRAASLEADAEREIREAFAQLGSKPAREILVPYCAQVTHFVKYDTLADAMLDVLHEGYADEELIAALESSQCPYVAKLRDKLCSKWIADNATAVAEARLS